MGGVAIHTRLLVELVIGGAGRGARGRGASGVGGGMEEKGGDVWLDFCVAEWGIKDYNYCWFSMYSSGESYGNYNEKRRRSTYRAWSRA